MSFIPPQYTLPDNLELPNRKSFIKKGCTKRICSFDVETTKFLHGRRPDVFCCGFYDGEEYFSFWGGDCIAQFIQFLEDRYPGQELVIYVHNLGGFDINYLIPHITPDLSSKSYNIINGKFARVFIGGQEFRDSLRILPEKLEKFGDKEMQKLNKGYDYDWHEEDVREQYRERIEEYLRADCLVLHRAVCKFIDLYGYKLTIGSAATQQLHALHGFDTITEDDDTRLRPYFIGGHTEVFKQGRTVGHIRVIDVNSMYPKVMKEFFHPVGKCNEFVGGKVNGLTCFIRLRCKSKGYLPFRTKNKGIEYPIGVYEFHITIHEYNVAMELNLISGVEILSVFDCAIQDRFDAFVEKFYRLRLSAKEDGNALEDVMYKILLNAAYGRFAIRTDDFCETVFSLTPMGDDWNFVETLGFEETQQLMVYERPASKREKDRARLNVATAASITGAARSVLMWAIYHNRDRVLYCDTDSLFILGEPRGVLLDPSKLGAWKLEYADKDITEAHIGGKKTYALFDTSGYGLKTGLKGGRAKPEEIARIVAGEVYLHKNDAPAWNRDGTVKMFVERSIRNTTPDGFEKWGDEYEMSTLH
jgi:hypothetical protein